MMNEYAIRIFCLVEQSSKLDAIERIGDIITASVPYMKEAEAKKIILSYERASEDMVDLDERDSNAKAKLTKIFGSK